jgi:nucleotide-binding universal stress UspA family protein
MNVVVGYDGSEHANRALDRAMRFAGDDGRLIVVASAEPDVEAPLTEGGRQDPSEVRNRREAIEQARAKVGDRPSAELIEVYGDPGTAIVKAANDSGADLVVVGSRGLSRIERLLLGSVSTKVVQRAHCDVLVVR